MTVTLNGSPVPNISRIPPFRYISKFLTNGGSNQATGNYATATSFILQPPPGQVYLLSRFVVKIGDDGPVDAGSYGNGITLTNGITVNMRDDSGVIVDMTDGSPVLTNGEWATFSYDVTNTDFGAGLNYVLCRWTLAKAGASVCLVGDNNERLEVVLHDDFTGLATHTFLAQGTLQ